MSTQTSTFPAIPFTHTHPQQSFRLLELPPELLELLSSDNPPTYVIYGIQLDLTLNRFRLTKSTRLYLKSSNPPTNVSSTTTPRTKGAEAGYVHLCSPTQTYQVRQVSTSNSLFVTQPAMLFDQNTPSQPKGETDAAHEDEVAL